MMVGQLGDKLVDEWAYETVVVLVAMRDELWAVWTVDEREIDMVDVLVVKLDTWKVTSMANILVGKKVYLLVMKLVDGLEKLKE